MLPKPRFGLFGGGSGYFSEDQAMATMKLTKRTVEGLKAPDPSGKQTLYWADGNHTGLGILVSGVAATQSWVVQGKLKSGQTRRVTIGPVSVFSIDEAWEEARAKLAEIYRGGDPKVSAQRRARGAVTLSVVLDDYLAANSNLSRKSIAGYRNTAARHLAPWQSRPLREISAEMVEARFRAITEDISERVAAGKIKGGVAVDGRTSANNALQLFRALWNHQAERDPDLPRNPTWILRRQWYRLERRDRHVRADDLPRFYGAARTLPSDIQRDLVLFGLFTGMRESEAAGLQWAEIDLPQRMIRVPARRMKAHKSFELPMSSFVADLLIARRALGDDGSFVFPGDGKTGHCQSFTFALRQIGAKSGIQISPHDLRRTFATVAEATEISPLALKLLVAHSTGGDVTSGYTIMSPARLREAAEKVCARLKELCGIEAREGVARIGGQA
jgi:integrase